MVYKYLSSIYRWFFMETHKWLYYASDCSRINDNFASLASAPSSFPFSRRASRFLVPFSSPFLSLPFPCRFPHAACRLLVLPRCFSIFEAGLRGASNVVSHPPSAKESHVRDYRADGSKRMYIVTFREAYSRVCVSRGCHSLSSLFYTHIRHIITSAHWALR